MISAGRLLNRQLLNRLSRSSKPITTQAFVNSLFSKIPQGFKNFYPKLEKNAGDPESDSNPKRKTADSSDKRRSSHENKNGGGKPPSEDPNPSWTRMLLFLGFGVGSYTLTVLGMRYIFAQEK